MSGAGALQLTLETPAGLELAPWAPKRCDWCGGPLETGKRRDAETCSKSCRQARHRFSKGLALIEHRLERAATSLRLAYADPPYPGNAHMYRDHPDYGGEVDHAALLEELAGFDGWALSTSATALPSILTYCVALELDVRVASWVRGERPRTRSGWPLSAWEPVVYAGGRRIPSRDRGIDVLTHAARPRKTDPGHVIGAKPAAFAWWLFELLDAQVGDELVDLFPGSGGISRAWRMLETRARARELMIASSPATARARLDALRGSLRSPLGRPG